MVFYTKIGKKSKTSVQSSTIMIATVYSVMRKGFLIIPLRRIIANDRCVFRKLIVDDSPFSQGGIEKVLSPWKLKGVIIVNWLNVQAAPLTPVKKVVKFGF